MLPAFLTAICFAFSIVCAGRSTRLVGATNANFLRLLVAMACLSAFAFTYGSGLKGAGISFFLISGAVGIGVGDFFTFQAIKRIGPRLSVLLVQCLCAPIAALVEFGWLGTRLTVPQLLGGGIALLGTAITLVPGIRIKNTARTLWVGTLLAILAATAQATGAVLTRKANDANLAGGFSPDSITAAFQRMCGAFFVMLIVFMLVRRLTPQPAPEIVPPLAGTIADTPASRRKAAAPWIVANALAGLVFGVASFQWALEKMPAAIVLSIVALTPLITMPIVWVIDNDRPGVHAILGGVVAISGVILLKWN